MLLRIGSGVAGSFARTRITTCVVRAPATAAYSSTLTTTSSERGGRNASLYGTPEPLLPAPVQLVAGDVTVSLCGGGGGVLSIDFGGIEVNRGVSFVHRDGGWGTTVATVTDPVAITEGGDDGSVATWSTSVAGGTVVIANTVKLSAVDNGWVHFTATATARNVSKEGVETCRTGFVVLHPASLGGQHLQVGTASHLISATFPNLVAPNQLFTDINSISHDVKSKGEILDAVESANERDNGAGTQKRASKLHPQRRKQVLYTFESTELDAGTELDAASTPPTSAQGLNVSTHQQLWEMEDQRQWLDGSFKTYYRPLRAGPLPYTIDGGGAVQQTVDIHFTTTNNAAVQHGLDPPENAARGNAAAQQQQRSTRGEKVTVNVGRSTGAKVPAVGTNVRPWLDRAPDDQETACLPTGGVVWCRYDHVEDGGDFERERKVPAVLASLAELVGGTAPAANGGHTLVLQVELPCKSFAKDALQKECASVAAALEAAGLQPTHIFLIPKKHVSSSATADYHLPPDAAGAPSFVEAEPSNRFDYTPLDTLLAAARAAFPAGMLIGMGSATSFTELNRRRPPTDCDFISHSATALIHDASDRAVMQCLEAVQPVAETVRELWPTSRYIWGPTAIAEATGIFGQPRNEEQLRRAMATSDPRSRGCFGAAWMLGVASKLFPLGAADAVVLGDAVGDRGVLYDGPSAGGGGGGGGGVLLPSFHVVAALAAAAGESLRDVDCSDSSKLSALSFSSPKAGVAVDVWLANLTAAPLEVALCDLYAEEEGRAGGAGGGAGGAGAGGRAVWTVLDHEHAEQAAADEGFMRMDDITACTELHSLDSIQLDAFGVARIVLLA